jgi:hypothetical protein
MKHILQSKTAAFVLGLGMLTSACSDVSFAPGGPPPAKECTEKCNFKTDNFRIDENRPAAKVDILFIEDNSMSMSEDQAKLASRFSSFIASLKDVDWRLGLTTTNVDAGTPYATEGKLVTFTGTNSKYISKATSNYATVFTKTINAWGTRPECESQGTNCASGNEQAMEAARRAIALRDTANAGFFRTGADLIVLVLSDEDELSDGNDSSATRPEDVIEAVQDAWLGTKDLTGYGIIIRPSDSACYRSQVDSGGHYGTFVQRLARLTDGETGSICDTDYGPALESIGDRVVRKTTSVQLSALPLPHTVVVQLIPEDSKITWELIGKKIQFSDLPAKGTRVIVTYETAP